VEGTERGTSTTCDGLDAPCGSDDDAVYSSVCDGMDKALLSDAEVCKPLVAGIACRESANVRNRSLMLGRVAAVDVDTAAAF
jgi:hypothetical protein